MSALYRETNTLVYSLAIRMLGDAADAEEVTLDVYTQVWRSAKSYNADRGTVAGWLVMLTRSRAVDRLRGRASRRKLVEPAAELREVADGGMTPEQESLAAERRRRVREALGALPAEQREALELAYFGGLSHSELAERLGHPLGTVKTRIRLGMIKMQELLGRGAEKRQ